MNAPQDSRDFVRLLTGRNPGEVSELRSQEIAAAESLETQQQEQTRSQRLEFIRRLTGKTNPTEKESTK